MTTCPVAAGYDRTLTWVCARMVDVDDGRRDEILDTARAVSADSNAIGRGRELWSMVALALTLRARRSWRGGVVDLWRQGAHTAAPIAIILAAALGSATLGLAAGAALAVIAGVGDRWPLVGAGLAATFTASAAALGAGLTLTTLTSLGAAGFALGRPSGRPVQAIRRAFALALGAVIAIELAQTVGPLPVVAVGTIALPAALTVLAAHDPRLGATAVVLFGWRFIATDPKALVAAVSGLRDEGSPYVLLARYVAMCTAVITAALVTTASARRAQRL